MANAVLYGFSQLKDLATTLAIEVDRDQLMSAINMSRAQHDAEVNAILNLFSEETTNPQEQFAGSTVTRNQPLDEFGRSLPIKPPAPYTVGYPIWASGNAIGSNFVTNEKMTVAQLQDKIASLYFGDFAWTRDEVLGTIFDNVGYSFTDPQFGAVAVKGLANGDAVTYVSTSGTILATDTHYLAQASAIDNSNNPYDDLYAELTEHPGNGTEVIAFINNAQVATTQALTNFVGVTDPDITPASTSRTLSGRLAGAAANTFPTPLGQGRILPGSSQLIGKTDNVWIVQWNFVPANYIIAIASNAPPPLKRRVDPEANLNGFKPVAEIAHFPYFEQQWFRRMGFGSSNRVGAAVFRVGNGTYAVPTGYGVPMS